MSHKNTNTTRLSNAFFHARAAVVAKRFCTFLMGFLSLYIQVFVVKDGDVIPLITAVINMPASEAPI